jgi:uncharacterized membrane protein YhhN
MNKRNALILFTIIVLAHLLSLLLEEALFSNITKFLLVPSLTLWLWMSRKKNSAFLLLALAFSWFGDILLMFQTQPIFFILGLGSFLIAHVFYITTFHQATDKPDKGLLYKLVTAGAVILCVVGFLGLIGPSLGEMRVPVYAYAAAIGSMLWAALNRYKKTSPKSFVLVTFGAFLFVFSDAMIAWNKFVGPFWNAGLLIMLTYIAAQTLIVSGLLKH